MKRVPLPTSREKLPLSTAFLWIFLSTVLISGSVTLGWMFHQSWLYKRSQSPVYTVRHLVQTGPQYNALPSIYLAEVMGLSIEQPVNLYQVRLKELASRLQASPVIEQAEVQIQAPDTLYVNYTAYQPLALWSDYENVALSTEGIPFPLEPFFTPKILPKIRLGSSIPLRWNENIKDPRATLALEALQFFLSHHDPILEIDASYAFAGSKGQQQLIVTLGEGTGQRVLRLPVKGYQKQMENYHKLAPLLSQWREKGVIDLRLAHHAYIYP